ncbi:MAG TPA: right-handed parallel beta-helix repeat-containing protein, partial [Anaerolineae bacterium]|nr:right-handed parallel beta-helix repeat-containing protein [Anaerolineae bacterium]
HIFSAPSGGSACDPSILKYGNSGGTDDLIVFHAPGYSDESQPLEYIYSTDAGATWNASSIAFTDAAHGTQVSWDMMPRAYLKDSTTILVLASMEQRGVSRGQGDIVMIEFPVSAIGNAHYTAIQDGIDNAAAGDVVKVAKGTYVENLWVNKSLELAGAGADVVTIYPAVSLPNPSPCTGSVCGTRTAASNIILTEASDITIHGFTLDGDNPGLTSGIVRGGADLDARNGIIEFSDEGGVFNNLVVYNTTVKNIYLRGIQARSYGSGLNLHHNTVTNVQGESQSIAIFNFGGSGKIEANVVSYANDAISANHSRGTQFLDNIVTHSRSGVHTDNNGSMGGVADLIQGNNVSEPAASAYGIWVFAPYLAVSVDQNTVTGHYIGLCAAGQFAAVTPTFTRNTVDGGGTGLVGVWVTTNLFGWGSSNVLASFSNNYVRNNPYGVYLVSEEGYSLGATLKGNSVTANTYAIVYNKKGPMTADASANWWGASDPAAVAGIVRGGAVIDYTPWLASGTDTAPGTPGFQGDFSTLWVDDDSPQTGTVGRIQEGINLVSGSTVHVAAGTYTERVIADKAVTLLGPNAGVDPCSGSRVAEAEIHTDDLTNHQAVLIQSSDVTVDGFTLYGPNGTIKDIAAVGLDGTGPRTNVHIQYNRIFRTAGGTDWNGDGIRLDPPSDAAASIYVEHNRIEVGPEMSKGNNDISTCDHGYRTDHGDTWILGAPDRVTIAYNCLYGHGKMYVEGIGVLIDHNSFQGIWGPIEVRGAKDVVISNNEMLNQVDIGIFAWSPKTASGKGVCTDLQITGNTIQGMQLDPQNFTDEGTAIVLGGVTNATVSGNNLTGNASYGVVIAGIGYDHFYPEDIGWGGGLDVGYNPVNNVLEHNNISGNVVAGVINKTTVMVNAENNWWGDASGPLDTNGTSECPPCNSNAALDKNLDGAGNAVSEYVDYCPWLGAPPPEAGTLLYLDPVLGSVPNDHTTTKTYTVRIANVANMYGYQFVVSFDPAKLECTAAAFDGTFFPIEDGESFAPSGWNATIDNVNGKVYFARTLLDPEPALTGSGPLATVTFRGDTGASDGQYKLDFQQTKLSNKDGDALPVTAQFGWLELYGTGNLAGSVDLQGRSNESGAVVTIISVGGHTAWTTTVVNGSWSFTGIPAVSYQVNIEQERYLDAQKGAAGSGVVVTAGGTTTLSQVKLLGGDANDDDVVDISDGTIIGGKFGQTVDPATESADINADGTVDIMDLVLFGGNYSKTSPVPWS